LGEKYFILELESSSDTIQVTGSEFLVVVFSNKKSAETSLGSGRSEFFAEAKHFFYYLFCNVKEL